MGDRRVREMEYFLSDLADILHEYQIKIYTKRRPYEEEYDIIFQNRNGRKLDISACDDYPLDALRLKDMVKKQGTTK